LKTSDFNPQAAARYLLFTAGLFVMGVGINLIVKSGLGISPISSVPYVLSLKFDMTLGQFTFLFNTLFILSEVILLNKNFPKKQYFQILVTFVFSFFIDISMNLISFIHPVFYLPRIFSLLAGIAILAFGTYMQLSANVIINSAEGLVKAIAEKTGKSFGNIKILFDLTLTGLACLISFLEFGRIRGLREGTFISSVLVGLMTKIYAKILPADWLTKTEEP
jgi:uncharacterized membrane protein YczE